MEEKEDEVRQRMRAIVQREIHGRYGAGLRRRYNTEGDALACLMLLSKVVANVLESAVASAENKAKFRSLSCSSTAFKTKLRDVRGGVDFLTALGFRKRVANFEAKYILEDSLYDESVMKIAADELKIAVRAAEEKIATSTRMTTRDESDSERREALRRDIAEDRRDRREREALRQPHSLSADPPS